NSLIMSQISTTFQKIFFVIPLSLALNLLCFNLTFASSPGDLDTSFNGTGIVTTSVSSSFFDGGFGLAIQPDNKIIVAGLTVNDFALVRYTSDGVLDTDFKSTGVVTTSIGSRSGGYSLALQQDGKIVVVGTASNSAFEQDIAVVRYNPDGTLDTDFKSTGVVTTHLNGHDIGRSVVIQNDGRIVVAGYTYNEPDFIVLRYDTNGELDTNFNTTGIVSTSVGVSDIGYTVLIQNDNKIIVAGETDNQVAVLRYTPTGQLDTEFNGTGVVTTSIGSYSGSTAAVLQADDKVIVAGYASTNGSSRDFALARYNSNGSLDTTFGSTGIITTRISSNNDEIAAITMQPNNKIVVVGGSNLGLTTGNFAIARYNPDGSLDTTFGNNGIITTTITDKKDKATGVKIQTDGKIVVGGYENEVRGSGNFAVVRYIGNFTTYLPIIMKQ
ncbi:MAG: hypothetical protein GY797_21850, partial [Deltaproteobacteria bacterium]|nr:hypothetical protein [Deltaproteobacteria bacterium]